MVCDTGVVDGIHILLVILLPYQVSEVLFGIGERLGISGELRWLLLIERASNRASVIEKPRLNFVFWNQNNGGLSPRRTDRFCELGAKLWFIVYIKVVDDSHPRTPLPDQRPRPTSTL